MNGRSRSGVGLLIAALELFHPRLTEAQGVASSVGISATVIGQALSVTTLANLNFGSASSPALWIGGTVTPAATAKPGIYTGTIVVTIAYL